MIAAHHRNRAIPLPPNPLTHLIAYAAQFDCPDRLIKLGIGGAVNPRPANAAIIRACGHLGNASKA